VLLDGRRGDGDAADERVARGGDELDQPEPERVNWSTSPVSRSGTEISVSEISVSAAFTGEAPAG
jgi:hypothetical protein